ncbi:MULTISPECIES: 1,2-phenylacetyl-CoA epoxidase subunit PaaD [Acinetobacter]|jgi:ring-1,2-phenylacetyl-CoA epoxidase subunit PaaD|uniref:Phenylacetate-CoA oxygenase subunit PaaJ n=2 Tax=Acinetobacter radioresistens TaxID=40216 RepID=A0A2T1IXF2_ACIRA|nr:MULTISPECIES: 1,2-phenylacetyl-CoA epoxidase subunit PaaD [Acinetobacter]AWV86303.1 phenylacetate-CoA oxygenase subunit PaaJ [Acinetobacter radioresistens]EJO33967.1 phenylacetate-CoA oxygenase, PaaJ subunit [Acinetobacter radioresistens WC-A-157]ENV89077.1 phenylacetate-CoA oxygenase, PaaJ subunit [Acinetobacter radioresistens DSM 6976 = NBRC 102413 = CIP 103788]EXB31880.1 phenylacetate-CoA oxygenase, PaaJ subunit [Acinetobacter sp. 1461402]EXB72807.1 phenylacetate-CoA oxygenase, PaaJ subu
MELIKHCLDECWETLKQVADPEIPVLSVVDLGMIRGVELNEEDQIIVRLTPTYSGCPATDLLKAEITQAFTVQGLVPVQVVVDLSEVWTTDWMSESGKQKLQQYGIAPPQGEAHSCGTHVALSDGIECPRCHSQHTKLLSEFSSTACKALYRCQQCLEPFDYFKCI